MKHDIRNKDDIKLMVDTFYGKVQESEILGFIFNDIAEVDWATHLPHMYNFWAGILFGENEFRGQPMYKHIILSKKTKMSDIQFAEWLRLFGETVLDLFEGPRADEAIARSQMIARNFLYRINQVEDRIK
ncbi:MAG: group III truncated hemoglobin [Leptolyngbya sp. SIO1D8]|nr:group III truncated hemoglobin [Leptolyngbya sp. SIO1D8]